MFYENNRQPATQYSHQNQLQNKGQSQLVDQNYANGTFFMAMSTI